MDAVCLKTEWGTGNDSNKLKIYKTTDTAYGKSVTLTITSGVDVGYNSSTHEYTATSYGYVNSSLKASSSKTSGTRAYEDGQANPTAATVRSIVSGYGWPGTNVSSPTVTVTRYSTLTDLVLTMARSGTTIDLVNQQNGVVARFSETYSCTAPAVGTNSTKTSITATFKGGNTSIYDHTFALEKSSYTTSSGPVERCVNLRTNSIIVGRISTQSVYEAGQGNPTASAIESAVSGFGWPGQNIANETTIVDRYGSLRNLELKMARNGDYIDLTNQDGGIVGRLSDAQVTHSPTIDYVGTSQSIPSGATPLSSLKTEYDRAKSDSDNFIIRVNCNGVKKTYYCTP